MDEGKSRPQSQSSPGPCKARGWATHDVTHGPLARPCRPAGSLIRKLNFLRRLRFAEYAACPGAPPTGKTTAVIGLGIVARPMVGYIPMVSDETKGSKRTGSWLSLRYQLVQSICVLRSLLAPPPSFLPKVVICFVAF